MRSSIKTIYFEGISVYLYKIQNNNNYDRSVTNIWVSLSALGVPSSMNFQAK